MSPSRGLTAALLCALLGASAGARTPQAASGTDSPVLIPAGKCAGNRKTSPDLTSGPAFNRDFDHPLMADEIEKWRSAGYSVDPYFTQVISPSGYPITNKTYEYLSEPFNASDYQMTGAAWSALIFAGYRLEDATCHILDPKKRKPVTRLEILGIERQTAGSGGASALEELVVDLKLPPDPTKPPAPWILARMAELERRGERLPKNLRRALRGQTMSAGQLRGEAENAYSKMLRAWEGSRDLMSLAGSALPPIPGFTAPATRKGRIEPWEKVVGDGISSDVQALFSRTEAGRELTGRFKDAMGRSDLPKMTVLKFSQSPGRPGEVGYAGACAIYDYSSRTMVLNHWYVVGQILAGIAPDAREKLGTQLSDSRALAEYLRAHPAQRAAIADRLDVMVFHELTHAWQHRRQTLGIEEQRMNAPSSEILPWEHEAFFAENHYLHEKLMVDPSAALRIDRGSYYEYLAEMNDPVKYRDQITRHYQETIRGSTDFQTVAQVQAERRSIWGVPAGKDPIAWARAFLERAGLNRGDAALKQARDDQAEKEKTYFRVARQMQAEAGQTLSDRLRDIGRPDMGLQLLTILPRLPHRNDFDFDDLDRRPLYAAETAALLAHPPAAMSLEERLLAFSPLYSELQREGKRVPPENVLAYADDMIEYARRSVNRSERLSRLEIARSWLHTLSSKNPRTRALKANLDSLEKAR